MTNEAAIILSVMSVCVAGGFLLAIPLLKSRHRSYLEKEEKMSSEQQNMKWEIISLTSKVDKLKHKIKKSKKNSK